MNTHVRRAGVATLPASRAFRLLAVSGAVLGAVVVVAGGRVGLATSTTPLTRWLGLLAADQVDPRHSPWPGLVLAAGVCALVVLWLYLLGRVGRSDGSSPDLWRVAGWWALPFLIGPPILSSDVFSYAAQGLLVAQGHDPYTSGPSALGWGPTLAAVDPSWRSEPSPYGPLATLIEHMAVVLGGGTALGAIIVLRLFAVVGVVATGVLVMRLAGPDRRSTALALTVLNPLTFMYVVSGAHFEGVMCALLLAAIFAANQGQFYLGLMLGCAAGAIKAPAMVVVLAIVFVTYATAYAAGGHLELRRLLLRGVGVIAACWLVFTLLVPNGWGWLRSLGTPALTSTPAAISTVSAALVSLVMPSSAQADAAYACRVTALIAALVITGYLLLTAHHRPLAKTTGLALVAMSLLSPVFYPWYALWGLVCLAPLADRRARNWLAALSALAATVNLPGLTTPRAATFDVAVMAVVAAFAVGLTRMRRSPAVVRTSLNRLAGSVPSVHRDDSVVVRLAQRNADSRASIPTPAARIMNSRTEAKTTKL